MARHGQLLAQGRDGGLVAGELGLHRGHVEPGAAAQLVGLGDEVEVGLVALGDVFRRGDLSPQGRDGDGLVHHLGAQGQIGGLGLQALGLGPGQQRLALAPALAEQVEVVPAVQAERIDGEGRVREADRAVRPRQVGEAERSQVHPLFLHAGVGVQRQAGILRQHRVLRLGQGRAGGLQGVVAGHGLAHHRIDLRRAVEAPPVCGQPIAQRRLGRGRVSGHGVARRGGGCGRLEVRTDGGARGQQAGGAGAQAQAQDGL